MYIHGTVPQWIAVTAYKCAFCCRMGLERVSFLECSMHQSLCPATLWDLLSNIKKARRQNIMLGSLQIISGVTKPIPFVALSWLRWETRIPISQHVIKSQKRTNHSITAHNYARNLLFSKPFVGGEPRPGNLHKQPCPCKPYINCPAHAENNDQIKSPTIATNSIPLKRREGGVQKETTAPATLGARSHKHHTNDTTNCRTRAGWCWRTSTNNFGYSNGRNKIEISKPWRLALPQGYQWNRNPNKLRGVFIACAPSTLEDISWQSSCWPASEYLGSRKSLGYWVLSTPAWK